MLIPKANIKIPNLYPTETIEINDEKIVINEYKPADKPYVIAIQRVQKQIRPIMKKIGELESEINEISQSNEGAPLTDKQLKEQGLLERIYEINDEVEDLQLDVEGINDQLVFGDSETDEPNGPAYILAQRGLKRFYYSDKTTSELDELDDIPVGSGYITLIANTMINLAKPPSGLERSLMLRQKELEEADKGKSGRSKGKRTSRRKKN